MMPLSELTFGGKWKLEVMSHNVNLLQNYPEVVPVSIYSLNVVRSDCWM